MKNFLLIIFLFLNLKAHPQNEFNVWYFGQGVGLDFSSGSPVLLPIGSIWTQEGCASIADATGSLLFYTDGVTVYNKNHIAMPNGIGLSGGSSSSQSANILQMPGSPGTYYIFTTPNSVPNGQLKYSIVDMSLQGGMGDVTILNVPVMDSTVEGQTIVPHANGTDYWVVGHKCESSSYYAYLVNASGVNPPVVSTTGTYMGSLIYDLIGYIKPSPCGNKVVYANTGGNYFDLSDFNNSTGVLSNTITLPSSTGTGDGCYGVEFSPDGSLLYGAVNGTGEIFQFDLTAGSPAAIIASKTLIGIGYGNNLGALQLAPDNKIYVGRYGFGYLGVINDPNTLGVACNYADSGLFLGGGLTNWGLPGHYKNIWCNLMPVALFNAPHHLCPGTCTDFVNLSLNATSYEWILPGGSPATSTDVTPNICYNTPGLYGVTLIASNAASSDTTYLPNYITVFPYSPPQSILQGGDTLFSNTGFVTYQWFFDGDTIPGATNHYYVALQGGNYSVVCIDGNGCSVEAVILNVIASIQSTVDNQQTFLIFPNPVVDELGVRIPVSMGTDFGVTAEAISIYNTLGETVFSVVDYKQPTVDCKLLSSGTYWIEFVYSEKVYRAKFIKQ